MSNCISLISCDGLCPDIHNIKDPSRSNLLPYLNTLVQINGNVDCTYVVKEPLLVGFQMDSIEFLCDLSQPNGLNAYGSVSYSVNSVTYNGNEFINTPNFPSYTIDPNSFDCLDCDTDSLLCVGNTTNSNNSNAHSQNLTNILLSLGLNIQVFPYGDNGSFVFRIYENDSFTIEIERTSIPNPGVYQFFYVNGTLSLNFNGINITTNLINDDTNTCATRKTGYEVTTFSAVSTCGVVNNYGDYVTVNECDVITIFPMGVTCSVVNTFGRTGSTRSATLVVTGGTPPYNFLWENGNTTGTIINLPSGTYNAVVTDAFGDFVVNTSCFLPPVDCTQITINTNISYTCQVNSSYSQTGFAFLSLIPSGGFSPYTFSGSINNVVTTITDGMLLNDGDLLNVVVFDTNGCSSEIEFLGIVCPPGPTPTPLPFDPLACLPSVICPVSPNSFLLSFTAYTLDVGTTLIPSKRYEFKFNLSSPSNYSGTLKGSYKIYDVDIPNSFLALGPTLQTNLSNKKYWRGAGGTPEVSLNDYVEFGFNELTPINPTNANSPWNVAYHPYNEKNSSYVIVPKWIPGTTSIQVSVALIDENYCVHKGTTTISIPLVGGTSINSISF